jgi:hypothetical protein
MSLAQIRDKFMQPAGTRVRLGLTQGGSPKQVDLTLRDYV